ncbi:GNAT family N-acetyltransferase [Flexibacterium corallicola]|uniref:GNAT family N-acetyltransferase n=1 Tax=Flexibacterium corallicola TaxID=3037259 RepID=UPI00286F9A80|nr:GNAT family N-acetyltransferase [Pseudovibrio sp. M1P-2-3]
MIVSWLKQSPAVIEKANEDMLPELARIHAQSFSIGWGTSELRALYAQKNTFFFVARSADTARSPEPLGFLIVRSAAGEAEVLTIGVSPNARGNGIGRKLMEAGMFHLYSERNSELFLEVDEANKPAVALYKNLGFVKVGERKGYYSSSQGFGTALVMRCNLN